MMEPTKAFEALAHETRLAIVRLLIPAGKRGLTAGAIGEAVGARPNALSFHLGRLTGAGLLQARRSGRNQFYATDYGQLSALLGFLTDDCCAHAPEGCLADCPTGPGTPSLCCSDSKNDRCRPKNGKDGKDANQ